MGRRGLVARQFGAKRLGREHSGFSACFSINTSLSLSSYMFSLLNNLVTLWWSVICNYCGCSVVVFYHQLIPITKFDSLLTMGDCPNPSYKSVSKPSRPVRVSRYDSEGANVSWGNSEEKAEAEGTLSSLENAFSGIIQAIGDPDPDREALSKTPHRAAKALLYFTKGYEENLQGKYILTLCRKSDLVMMQSITGTARVVLPPPPPPPPPSPNCHV